MILSKVVLNFRYLDTEKIGGFDNDLLWIRKSVSQFQVFD